MNLLTILQTKRADGSIGDYMFRASLIAELFHLKPTIIGDGNIFVATDPTSTILFSCHVDDCHSVEESDGSIQRITEDFGIVGLHPEDPAGCLGADDGVGIYIMLEMIKAGVPGGYIFHTGEECGANGSRTVAAVKSFTSRFDMIVAFDRAVHPGADPEIIVTQGGSGCASVQCGQALADALNTQHNFGYYVSHEGVFTDTKVYRNAIAECFNLGCFYWDQHSKHECVNIEKVELLKNAAIALDWAALPIVRKPGMQHYKSDFGLRVVAGGVFADWARDKWALDDADAELEEVDDQATLNYTKLVLQSALDTGEYTELAHLIVMIGAADYCQAPTEGELAIIQDVNDIMDTMLAADLEENLGIYLEDLEYGVSPEIVLSCLYEDLIDTTTKA